VCYARHTDAVFKPCSKFNKASGTINSTRPWKCKSRQLQRRTEGQTDSFRRGLLPFLFVPHVTCNMGLCCPQIRRLQLVRNLVITQNSKAIQLPLLFQDFCNPAFPSSFTFYDQALAFPELPIKTRRLGSAFSASFTAGASLSFALASIIAS